MLKTFNVTMPYINVLDTLLNYLFVNQNDVVLIYSLIAIFQYIY